MPVLGGRGEPLNHAEVYQTSVGFEEGTATFHGVVCFGTLVGGDLPDVARGVTEVKGVPCDAFFDEEMVGC